MASLELAEAEEEVKREKQQLAALITGAKKHRERGSSTAKRDDADMIKSGDVDLGGAHTPDRIRTLPAVGEDDKDARTIDKLKAADKKPMKRDHVEDKKVLDREAKTRSTKSQEDATRTREREAKTRRMKSRDDEETTKKVERDRVGEKSGTARSEHKKPLKRSDVADDVEGDDHKRTASDVRDSGAQVTDTSDVRKGTRKIEASASKQSAQKTPTRNPEDETWQFLSASEMEAFKLPRIVTRPRSTKREIAEPDSSNGVQMWKAIYSHLSGTTDSSAVIRQRKLQRAYEVKVPVPSIATT